MLIVTIGRNKNQCDVIIDNNHISDKHAILYIHDNGKMFIEDNYSLNGTYVNDKNYPIILRQQINQNDTLFFSDHSLTVCEILNHVKKNDLGKRRADILRCPSCYKPIEASRRACPICGKNFDKNLEKNVVKNVEFINNPETSME